MDMYYVATTDRNALVRADDEASAWVAGHDALHNLQAETCQRTGLETTVEIQIVRLATEDEIAKSRSDEEILAQAMVSHASHYCV